MIWSVERVIRSSNRALATSPSQRLQAGKEQVNKARDRAQGIRRIKEYTTNHKLRRTLRMDTSTDTATIGLVWIVEEKHTIEQQVYG